MTPGIPGAGIGGLFYVCSSLVLGVRHCWRRIRRQTNSGDRRGVAQLMLLAVGIAVGVWIAGWFVGLFVSPDLKRLSRPGTTTLFGGSGQIHNALRIAAVVVGVLTLAVVMLGVELTRIWQRTKSNRLTVDAR